MAPQVHRLFFALKPDAPTAAALAQASAHVRALNLVQGRWPRGDKHHLTLHFLGDHASPDALIAAAKNAASGVRQAAFAVTLDHAASFGRQREAPCVLHCAANSMQGLLALHRALATALRDAGLGQYLERRAYVPHLTIARGTPLPQAVPIAPIHWQAREFFLIDSLVGRAVYQDLGCWTLGTT